LSTFVNETGEGASEQTSRLPREIAQDSRKKPCTSSKRTSTSSELVLFSKDKKGASLFTTLFTLDLSIFYLGLHFAIFQSLKIFFIRSPRPSSPFSTGIVRQKPPYLEGLPANA
jgi:hypothetical protein